VMSGLVLIGVFALSVRQMRAFATSGGTDELAVDVIAHDWWWEARYPNGATVANEMHIPVGRPVRLRLATADVIHSFWVPQLGPKMDMIPGRTNELVIEADEPGRYRGQCAEFCGLQHANMIFWVEALAPRDYELWVEREASPATPPGGTIATRGQRLFERSSCAGCHAIRGTPADGALGPDLTHIASRRTIGSGVLPMTERDLSRWIADPQEFKPGTTMPRTEIQGRDLQALVAYLLSLS
jgi:cytochrome c oxidase subunit II